MDGTPAGLDLRGFKALISAQQPHDALDVNICLQLAELAVEGAIKGLRERRDTAQDMPGPSQSQNPSQKPAQTTPAQTTPEQDSPA